ncbi:MAG: hypothetical protein IJJ09_07985 [Synergistaceae bacterium]|nr:hypothetical protein [Synergistaceae bacterium]
MLKKEFKLHCLIVNDFQPSDRSRDWLCMTLITPKQEGFTTFCVDEEVYNEILRRLSDEEAQQKFNADLLSFAHELITEGKTSGVFTFSA